MLGLSEPAGEASTPELYSLVDIHRVAGTSLRREQVIQTVIHQAMRVMQAEAASLWLVDAVSGRVLPLIALGPKAEEVQRLSLAPGEGVVGTAIAGQQAVLVPDVRRDPDWASRFDASTGFVTRSILCVPLQYQDRVIGALQFLNKKDGRLFEFGDLAVARVLAGQAAVAIEHSRLYEERRGLYLGIIRALVAGEETASGWPAGHGERVAHYALCFADALNLSDEVRDELECAGIFHGIADRAAALKGIPAGIAAVLQGLGERWDGRGPLGLAGEAIPLPARLAAIAGAFDALISGGPGVAPMPVPAALEEIAAAAGSRFDPELAPRFAGVMRQVMGEGGGRIETPPPLGALRQRSGDGKAPG